LEANGRGYWAASDDMMAQLQQLYEDVDDDIEGV
jgi:magnesium chelatase subunit H